MKNSIGIAIVSLALISGCDDGSFFGSKDRDAAMNCDAGSRIDWSIVDDLSKLEQCVWDVASQVRNVDTLNRWLELNDFIMMKPVKEGKNNMRWLDQNSEFGWWLSGGHKRSDIKIHMNIIDWFIVHSLSIEIVLNDKLVPVRVRAGLTRT